VKFNTYLKSCREHYLLTQEHLATQLHDFHLLFNGLDYNTVGRWEREISTPSLQKQVHIIEFFQTFSKSVFPCFETYTTQEIESQICRIGVENLLGKNKELILNFPSSYIEADNLKITQLKDSMHIENIIDIALSLDKEFTNESSQITGKKFKEWARDSSSFFLICEYKSQFFGLLFVLQLKPEIFDKLMNFELKEDDLKPEHFAKKDEKGCSYLLNFFAQSQKVSSLLYLRYYAYLIANQSTIHRVGCASMMEDGKKLIEKMNLQHHKSFSIKEDTMSFYQTSLSEVIVNQNVLKIIFQKGD